MSRRPQPGDIWRIDLGMVGKVRPALILSRYPRDDELAIVLIIPHTTSVRGNAWELPIPKPFLKPGVFHLQQVQPVSLAKLDAYLGSLTADELEQVKRQFSRLLDLRA